jgi:predicted phosphoadenosine phosphosulfate sulfurtransferase
LTWKIMLGETVLEAARARIHWLFDTFERLCVSFSGGKDSSVMLHLVASIARERGRTFSVLFVDWEVQFSDTIDHVVRMAELYQDVIEPFYWVALPMRTVNGLSQHQPEWVAWEPGAEWVRQPPARAIVDPEFFPFYRHAMTFEEFVVDFANWFAQAARAAVLIGIRSDESLNRARAIFSTRKLRHSRDKPWTTQGASGLYCNAYPIYDWKMQDIWTFHARTGLPYNSLYDLMYQAGVAMNGMRVCEPFGPEQRKGLWLYHVLEPETWARACRRVAGAASGARYARQVSDFYGYRTLSKPPAHDWKSYALFLLDSMPQRTAEHYRNKIAIYLRWYQSRGYPQDIPDEQPGDTGSKDIPSWRRICKTLTTNDFWCRRLSFSPTRASNYENYLAKVRNQRKEWGLL